MSYLPQYYVQDIPSAVMHDIIAGMQAALPEPSLDEIDQWMNSRAAATIEEWYERVAEFKVSR